MPRLPFGRVLGPPMTIVLFIVVGFLASTGRLTFLNAILNRETAAISIPAGEDPEVSLSLDQYDPASSVRLATFNLQRYGESKLQDELAIQRIAWIIRQFDLVAIQEITWKTDAPLEPLIQLINSAGRSYRYALSERLGGDDDKAYKEQYAFIWDSERLGLVEGSAYVVDDSEKLMSREPFVASFQSLPSTSGGKPFRFTLINVHTTPKAVEQELNVLDDVYRSVRAFEQPEDDIILLGDLNVEREDFGELGQLPGIETLNKTVTNTAGTRTIDHIAVDRFATTEFRGAGVINLQSDLQLSR